MKRMGIAIAVAIILAFTAAQAHANPSRPLLDTIRSMLPGAGALIKQQEKAGTRVSPIIPDLCQIPKKEKRKTIRGFVEEYLETKYECRYNDLECIREKMCESTDAELPLNVECIFLDKGCTQKERKELCMTGKRIRKEVCLVFDARCAQHESAAESEQERENENLLQKYEFLSCEELKNVCNKDDPTCL